jgi:alpha-glucosidase
MLRWDAQRIAGAVEAYEAALPSGAWPNWVLGNHDRPRIATRASRNQAGVAAMLLLTLRGTPTMYYGDELGIEDVLIPASAIQDPVGHNLGAEFSRDPARTPMQWDAGHAAGFTTGNPWLPLSPDHQRTNVAAQSEDAASVLNLYHRLIKLRRDEPALMIGSYAALPAEGDFMAYLREVEGSRFMIVLNLGAEPAEFDLAGGRGRVDVGTDEAREGTDIEGNLTLAANEGLVIRLTS